ncbi:MAG TPA: calcium-binding protein [Nocardioidaceae bacterium]|nr:calcium-binding protein [Nocardioidaceae bacterium]
MTRNAMRVAGLSGAATLVLGLLAGVPGAWADPPGACDGLSVTILGTDGDDVLTGTAGDDVVSLGAGIDRLDARGGNDVVCGGPGRDAMRGGAGDDRVFGEGDSDIVVGELGNDLVDGGDGGDAIYGDLLGGTPVPGADGADKLFGGAGDDRLELVSGDGFGGGGADVADGGEGIDMVSYETSRTPVAIDVPAGSAQGDADDVLTDFEIYRGSEYGDVLLGSNGPDVLDALESWGDRVDFVFGHAGDDTLTADEGFVNAGRGDDTFVPSGRGTYRLDVDLGTGDDRADIMQGGATIRGERGRDSFHVIQPDYGMVRSHVYGGQGRDLLSFAAFAHAVRADVGLGRATAQGLRMRFQAVEQVLGSRRADTLLGGARADTLRGRGGHDVLRGHRGDDLLVGGRGRDIAKGGRGHDSCAAERRSSCEKRP